MSGLEVLGAVSAATALAEQGGKVIKFACDIYSKYKHPEEIKRYLVQIQQLIDLSLLIRRNRTLQTTNMEAILGSCLADVRSFQLKLDKIKSNFFDSRMRKLRKSFVAVMQENDMRDLFANLERHKTFLALCICEIDSSLLRDIDINVRKVAGDIAEIRTTVLTINQKITPISEPVNMTDRKYYEVPNRRVDCFVGREDVLQRLESAAPSTQTGTQTQVFVLRGLGGQGKTQIALEYCRRAKERGIQAIFWIDSSLADSVKKSFQTMAAKLKRSDVAFSEDAAPFILETFREWPKEWVMVFDNYDDIKNFDDIRDYFPVSKNGTIIVTSRNSASEALCNHQHNNFIELEGLSAEDSMKLLRTRCRPGHKEFDEIAAKAIVDRLANHPLAITQAGSYIFKKRIRLNQFMGYYNKSRKEILNFTNDLPEYRRRLNSDEKETSLNVFTTWELSLQQLLATTESGKEKIDLLTLFSFFDCKDISEELFSTYISRAQLWPDDTHWPVDCLVFCLGEKEYPDSQLLGGRNGHCRLNGLKPWNSERFGELLYDLSDMSLVQAWDWGEDDFRHCSLHPLIKDWIRIRSTKEDTYKFSLISSQVLTAHLESHLNNGEFVLPLSAHQVLLAHIDVYTENVTRLITDALVSLDRWYEARLDYVDNTISRFLQQCGRYAEAGVIRQRLVGFSTKAFGVENENTLKCMNNLATSYRCQGKLKLAEGLYRQVLEGFRALLGPEHARTLFSTSQLAGILMIKADLHEAEKYARLAAESQERTLGFDNQGTLRSLHILAMTLGIQKNYKESEKIHKRVLKGREELFGPDHNDTLHTVEALGMLRKDMGDFNGAEEMLRRSLEGGEALRGSDHPHTLITLSNLGLVLLHMGRLKEAESSTCRAIEGKTKVFGRQHSETLISLCNLAMIFRDQGKFTESRELWKEALKGLQKVLGDDHSTTIKCLKGYNDSMDMIAEHSLSEISGTSAGCGTASSSLGSNPEIQTLRPTLADRNLPTTFGQSVLGTSESFI